MSALKPNTARRIEVLAQDLPLHCPMPTMRQWDAHPRVFLSFENADEVACPYCGTHYVLQAGERDKIKGH